MGPRTPESQANRAAVRERLVVLLNAHPGARLPALDGQSIDLSLALAGLMSEGDFAGVSTLVTDVSHRMVLAARDRHLLPVSTDLVEDAIALRAGDVEIGEVCRTSTLVPMLAAVAAFVDNEVALQSLRETLRPLMPEATLERWFPKFDIDQIAARRPDSLPGVSRGLHTLEATCAAEATAAVALPPGAAAPGDVRCVTGNQAVVLALSARVFRHPLPTWFLEQFRRTPESSEVVLASTEPTP